MSLFFTNELFRESQRASNRNANLFCMGKSGGAKIYRADGSVEVLKPFVHDDEPKQKTENQSEVNNLMHMDDKQSDCIDVEPEGTENSEPQKKGNEKVEIEDEEMER